MLANQLFTYHKSLVFMDEIHSAYSTVLTGLHEEGTDDGEEFTYTGCKGSWSLKRQKDC